MERFLQRLGATPNRWCLDPGGNIRGNTPKGPNKDCPLSAVAQHTAGKSLSLGSWRSAARAIGLTPSEAESVVRAADNNARHIPELRALLLAATVNRPAAREVPAPAPDPMDRALANLIAEGIPAEPTERELAIV